MTKPINLNKARKDRARASRKARADENAVRFSRTKQERNLLEARAEKSARSLDAHKRQR